MTSLRATLEGLVRDDGRPDITARKDELLSLIDSLSPHEIRLLKSHTEGFIFQKDIIIALPTEIVALIAKHFSIEDYMRARAVSKDWVQALGTPEVSAVLLETHFEDLFRQYRDLGENLKRAEKAKLNALLVARASLTLKREYGKFESVAAYLYPCERTWQNAYYYEGRIAIEHHDQRIEIITLDTSHTKSYMFPNREDIDRWAMTDCFLIASKLSPPTLWAWSLTQEDHAGIKIHLPSPCTELRAHGHHVLIRTENQQWANSLIWTIGGSVKAFDIPPLMIPENEDLPYWSLGENRTIITDFMSTGHIFVIGMAQALNKDDMNFTTRIFVQELFEGQQQELHIYDFPALLHLPRDCAQRYIKESTFGIGHCSGQFDSQQEASKFCNLSLPLEHGPGHITFDFDTKELGFSPSFSSVTDDADYFGGWPHPLASNPQSWDPYGIDSSGVVFKDRRYTVSLLGMGYMVWTFDHTPLPSGGTLVEKRTKAEMTSEEYKAEVLSDTTIDKLRLPMRARSSASELSE